jgi:competence protein ComEC
MALVWICIAWLSGIAIGSKLALPVVIIAAGLLPLLLIPFLHHHRNALILVSVCILLVFGGIVYANFNTARLDAEQLQLQNDKETVAIEGTIISDPELRDTNEIFQLSANRLLRGNTSIDISGKALVFTGKYPEYRYGDAVKITGTVKTPPVFDDFDYRGYLNQKGIRSIITYPKIELLNRDQGFKPLGWIYTLRKRLSQSLSLALPEPHNSLAQGMLLGLRGTIPQQLNEAFLKTGTTHILAISGLNISIFLGLFIAIGIWIFGKQRSLYIWLSLAIIWIYVFLTGMNAPVIRGAIMGSLFLVAGYLGRQRHAYASLAFAAAIMTALDPLVIGDVSFQLSFLSMMGLVFISPHLQSWGRIAINRTAWNEGQVSSTLNLINNSVAVTAAALIATLPVISYYFGIVSLVGIPATFFASLALPGIIVTTSLVGIVGLFTTSIAVILGWIAWLFLSYFIVIIQGFGSFPLASSTIPQTQIWQLCLYYVVLIGTVIAIYYHKHVSNALIPVVEITKQAANKTITFLLGLPRKWAFYSLIIMISLIWIAISTMPDDKLHVSILDIGQGDAILMAWSQYTHIAV